MTCDRTFDMLYCRQTTVSNSTLHPIPVDIFQVRHRQQGICRQCCKTVFTEVKGLQVRELGKTERRHL
jgi:hypothetical protein